MTWVGIDGYFYQPSDTFAWMFGTTIRDVGTFTRAPILISETAAGPSPDEADRIIGLFRDVRTDHRRREEPPLGDVEAAPAWAPR